MHPAQALFEWQPLAIAAFYKIEEDLHLYRALLVDKVSLGKI